MAVDPAADEVLWEDYERHDTEPSSPRRCLEFLDAIETDFPIPKERFRIFITGSGAAALAPRIGAKFVQEVNAVTLAVEKLHPEVGSVVELGGQDAKIIIFKEDAETGKKTKIPSMNDKCAGGHRRRDRQDQRSRSDPADRGLRHPLRRHQAAPRRRQVRRLRRDRHRQPAEEEASRRTRSWTRWPTRSSCRTSRC